MGKKISQIISGILVALLLGGGLGLVGYYLWLDYQDQRGEYPAANQENDQSTEEPDSTISLTREETISKAVEEISQLSPVEPVLGGSWYITRFWFIDDENFYVEYEDGHIMRRLLVALKEKEGEPVLEMVGYFEPGEAQWVLEEGKDPFSGQGQDLYEYDETAGKWLKQN